MPLLRIGDVLSERTEAYYDGRFESHLVAESGDLISAWTATSARSLGWAAGSTEPAGLPTSISTPRRSARLRVSRPPG